METRSSRVSLRKICQVQIPIQESCLSQMRVPKARAGHIRFREVGIGQKGSIKPRVDQGRFAQISRRKHRILEIASRQGRAGE